MNKEYMAKVKKFSVKDIVITDHMSIIFAFMTMTISESFRK
ncbi:25143_t:CDS:2 [Gigaspora margarita]|uniref:25143_t:CDS:1 n=1 Tax=Gigaspora margarita TaxID=4874 RepID=A0ABM8VZC3_GIGMA|nr:25143_t:CDS:2 [Gigaspora margarita]